ncbi:hypothetical protein N7495_008060 [Penicillium taxi]|uniref:uncharacterized protein n=1 Tax=Penicillium taxi TaxID=168475 RepID=UPI0025455613|nr:uncharacterized protein N7495_008060 [Penicillium taxi]KAJ5888019.1 hypothetical protein N7495_008060 [Penicillium taxi]
MSTHKSDLVSLARHHYPPSPFGRARDINYEFDLDTSNFPTPSKQHGTRPHGYRTSTLAGAYQAASRVSMADGMGIQMPASPSPRRARDMPEALSPSPQRSIPPDEFAHNYGRFAEDGTMENHGHLDDWDGTRSVSRLSQSSWQARERDIDVGSQNGLAYSETSFLDFTGAYSPRKRNVDYTKDEQRLRRVTGRDSAVFSKAKVGRAALTAENLQRREVEAEEDKSGRGQQQNQQQVIEDDGEHGPILNVPTNWASRTRTRQDWTRNIDQHRPEEDQPEPIHENGMPSLRMEIDPEPKPIRLSPRSLARSRIPPRNTLENRVNDLRPRHVPKSHSYDEETLEQERHALSDGQPIPNTPIVVYKNSTFIKPTPTKRDSQDLLRRLSRAESPTVDQLQTPEPPKLFEKQIYDKTPKVTVGGWVDTPMPERVTERVTEIPESTKVPTPPSTPPREREIHTRQPEPPTEAQPIWKNQKYESNNSNELHQEEPKTRRTRPPLIRPKLPKSALATLIEEVSSGKETLEGLAVGDDTLESLQELMNDPTSLKTEEEVAAFEKKVLAEIQQVASSNEHQKVDADKPNDQVHRLNGDKPEDSVEKSVEKPVEKPVEQSVKPDGIENTLKPDQTLELLQKTVEELRNGIKTLEKKVTTTTRPSSLKKSQEIGHSHSPSGTCEKCFSSDGRLYAAIPLPRLWKRMPQTGRRQVTKLGWFTIISLTWYVIECLMVEQYSHPFVSNTCSGYCLRPDAPHFPVVTVTMLWRWSHLSSILAPAFSIFVAFLRLMAQLLGLWDGYVDEPPRLGNLMGEIRINGTPVAFPWLSSPSAQSTQSRVPPPQQPVWTVQPEASVKWEHDQPSMDDDEVL